MLQTEGPGHNVQTLKNMCKSGLPTLDTPFFQTVDQSSSFYHLLLIQIDKEKQIPHLPPNFK